MFGMLENLVKAAVGVVTLPINMVADIPKALDPFDDNETRTEKNISDILDNLQKAIKP
jgi:hypothetical protein